MPIRFSTQAANADFLHDDAETAGVSVGMPQGAGGDVTPANALERKSRSKAKGEAKPGKDANAAGIVKDHDAEKP